MIRAVVFDMDGVLIEAKEWHYDALNRALALFGMEISRADHVRVFDGLSTRQKLEILSSTEGLPRELHGFINEMKQVYTMQIVNALCRPQFVHERALSVLSSMGLRLAVASNSVRASVDAMMQQSHLSRYLEFSLSNEDVRNAKPHPEIYHMAIERLGVRPEETLIVEDNDHGVQAARASGAHVLVVKTVYEVNIDNVRRKIAAIEEDTA